jgi:hypothetical protein
MELHDGNMAADATKIMESMMSSPITRHEVANHGAPKADRAGYPVNYMDPADTMPDISHINVQQVFGLSESKETEEVIEEQVEERTYTLTESELQTLIAAKEIIDRLTEATTVGCIGVNMGGPGLNKKEKKKKMHGGKAVKASDNSSFLSYLGKVK